MIRTVLLALLVAAATVSTAAAQRFPRNDWAPQQGGDPREAMVPFSQIQRDLRDRFGGELVDASLFGDVYEVTWVTRDGRRILIVVDARTGRVISTRG